MSRTRQIIQATLSIGITLGLIFGSAGRLDWWAGWIFLIFYLFTTGWLILLLKRHDPELLLERRERREGIKGWDRVLVTFYSLLSLPALMIVAGLNVRYGWAPAIGLPVRIIAFLVGAAGWTLAFRSMLSNTFFSTYVRIQTDRGHTVISTGPYRFIRHPGYTGNIIFAPTLPLFLGSVWALIPAGVATVVLVIRTALEDRTLRRELPGYDEYAERVRWRLIPLVW